MYTYNSKTGLFERDVDGAILSYNRFAPRPGVAYYELRKVKLPSGEIIHY